MNNLEVKKQIFDKIKEYNSIIILRHIRPDGDCVGATFGLRHILADSFKDKTVKVFAKDYVDYLSFLGYEDYDETLDIYKDSLVIVLDTATSDRISNDNFKLGKELIKIDHHIVTDSYGDINWVEEDRSSLCEMLVDFYETFKDELVLSKDAATCLYTGIISDSGRFKFSSTSGDTLRLSAVLLDTGIDIETIHANLYLKDFNMYKLQGEVLKGAKITPNGVAYIYVTMTMQSKYGLSMSDASAMISVIEGIKGSIMWIAFIDNNDQSIRVRLRSRFMTVNQIAEKYHGGGHDKASGATVYSRQEMQQLLKDADEEIKKYKESHTGWL